LKQADGFIPCVNAPAFRYFKTSPEIIRLAVMLFTC
jgi:hypothetical protein